MRDRAPRGFALVPKSATLGVSTNPDRSDATVLNAQEKPQVEGVSPADLQLARPCSRQLPRSGGWFTPTPTGWVPDPALKQDSVSPPRRPAKGAVVQHPEASPPARGESEGATSRVSLSLTCPPYEGAALPRDANTCSATASKSSLRIPLKGFAPASAKPRRAPPVKRCRPDATTKRLKTAQQKEAAQAHISKIHGQVRQQEATPGGLPSEPFDAKRIAYRGAHPKVTERTCPRPRRRTAILGRRARAAWRAMNLVLAQVAEELEHAGLSSPTHLPEPNRPTHQSGQTASDVPPAHCPVRRGPVLRIGATQLDPPSQGSVVTRGKLQSDRCFSPHEGSEADWVALHMPDGGKVRVPLASHCTVGDVVRAAWTAQTGSGYANDDKKEKLDLLVEGTRAQVDGQTIRLGDLLTFTNTAIPWRCVSLLKGSGKRTAAESLDQGGTRVRGRLATRICEASVEEGCAGLQHGRAAGPSSWRRPPCRSGGASVACHPHVHGGCQAQGDFQPGFLELELPWRPWEWAIRH